MADSRTADNTSMRRSGRLQDCRQYKYEEEWQACGTAESVSVRKSGNPVGIQAPKCEEATTRSLSLQVISIDSPARLLPLQVTGQAGL